jgi:flagellar biosynthesis protein FlhB
MIGSFTDQKERKWSFLQLTQAFSNNFIHEDVCYVISEMVTSMQGLFSQFSDNFVNLTIFSTTCVNLISNFYSTKKIIFFLKNLIKIFLIIYFYISKISPIFWSKVLQNLTKRGKKGTKFVSRN